MSGPREAGPVLALSGGIGGAKLALGLSHVLPAGALRVLANVGDDFEHFGLAICPDIDTLLYTLAGLADLDRGWGRRGETWHFMKALEALGGPAWFRLGDADLALHAERTRRLAAGASLSEITGAFARRLGVASRILPASDDPVRTRLSTASGWLPFQEYFVARRCEPVVDAIEYVGARQARASGEALALLRDPALRAVVICPSNPLLSIEPMLAMPGLREALQACAAPVIAVSPIVQGMAVKGPTAKLLRELGDEVDAFSAARRYAGLLDGYVIDAADAGDAPDPTLRVIRAPTLMQSRNSKVRLARVCLDLADAIALRSETPEAAL
ncbi:MAG: 2-phospho-L-lactate transferase [Burkholderiales bacterium]